MSTANGTNLPTANKNPPAEVPDSCPRNDRAEFIATAVKVFESQRALSDGATELDMVINIGQAIGGRWDAVRDDIAAVTRAAHDGGAIVKVIFENCYLSQSDIVRLCKICGEVRADYVTTSTGYGTGDPQACDTFGTNDLG